MKKKFANSFKNKVSRVEQTECQNDRQTYTEFYWYRLYYIMWLLCSVIYIVFTAIYCDIVNYKSYIDNLPSIAIMYWHDYLICILSKIHLHYSLPHFIHHLLKGHDPSKLIIWLALSLTHCGYSVGLFPNWLKTPYMPVDSSTISSTLKKSWLEASAQSWWGL